MAVNVHNDDVDLRLLETARSLQEPVAAPIAIQDHPSPVTDECATAYSTQNSGSIPVHG